MSVTGSWFRAGQSVTGQTSPTGTSGDCPWRNHSSTVPSSLKVMKARGTQAGGMTGPGPAPGVPEEAVGAGSSPSTSTSFSLGPGSPTSGTVTEWKVAMDPGHFRFLGTCFFPSA